MVFNIKNALSFLNSSYSPFDESTNEFIPVDKKSAEKYLQLEERGADNGRNNSPRANVKNKDAIAKDIDQYLGRCTALAKSQLLNRFKAILELSSNSKGSNTLEIIENIYQSASNKLIADTKFYYNELFTKKRNWINGEKEYDQFRKDNNIIGPARYPENKVMATGAITLALMAEIVINAFTLGDNHPNGTFGVIYETFMFAFVNIAASFLLGAYTIKQLYHVSLIRKMIGVIFSIGLVAGIFFLNLFVAHYRDSLAQLQQKLLENLDALNAIFSLGGASLNNLMAQPFGMGDFKSFLLFGFGIVLAIIASKKSFDLDDKYPGYGKLHREQQDLADQFTDMLDEVIQNTNEDVEKAVNDMGAQTILSGAFLERNTRRASDFELIKQKYFSWLEELENTGQALYAQYREADLKFRKGKQPICYDIDYKVPETAKDISINSFANSNKNVPSDSEIKKLIKNLTIKINKELTNSHKKFREIEKLSPDKNLENTTLSS